MRREDQFDSFYQETRRALVLQTYALTGDLRAAHRAAREAYTAGWQHWRKVSSLHDPQGWVRSRAWQLAQRRHSARAWRGNGGRPSGSSPVLTALGKLSPSERRTLLLTQLAELSPDQAAQEMTVSQATVEELNEHATADLAATLGVNPTEIRKQLLSLSGAASEARLPRASIIRRAGAKRRQLHTVVAAAAATATAIASGAFAYQAPTVQSSGSAPAPSAAPSARPPASAGPAAPEVREEPEQVLPSADELLDADQITRLGLGQEWRVARTHDNTSGNGINTTCQQTRFADPDGLSALVRTFEARGKPDRSAVQTIEISKSIRQARKTFATTVGWYSGCQVGRLQLLNAYRVNHIGDQANVLMIRVWERPVTTYSVAVARTGRVVTSTVGEAVGAQAAPPSEIVQSLADAVSMLCAKSGARDCSEKPGFTAVPPPPSGDERGILAVADLPPIGRIDEPWVGTRARPAGANPSATLCDEADFGGAGARKTRTRTYLIPGAKLPNRFGLSETYGVFGSPKAASGFLEDIRARMGRCEDRNPVADVSRSRTVHDPQARTDSLLWDLETEISDDAAVPFRLGFVRVGDTVAQVNFSPTGSEDMTPAQFEALVVRAADRLRELGPRPEG